VDKAIVEIFVNDGALYFVKQLNSVNAEKQIKAFVNGVEDKRKTILKKLEVHELNSVWSEKATN
jgi:sucrose-6-phosphate hydrolase SacC (GH32 family)